MSLYHHRDSKRLREAGNASDRAEVRPFWQIPLYFQPSRPTQAAIDAHRAAIAAERRLSVPQGISLLEQAALCDKEGDK